MKPVSIPERELGVLARRKVLLSKEICDNLGKMSESTGQDLSFLVKMFIMEGMDGKVYDKDLSSNTEEKCFTLSSQAKIKIEKTASAKSVSEEKAIVCYIEQGLERYRSEWDK